MPPTWSTLPPPLTMTTNNNLDALFSDAELPSDTQGAGSMTRLPGILRPFAPDEPGTGA